MPKIDVTELAERVERLESELAAIKQRFPAPKPPAPPAIDEGVRITTGAEADRMIGVGSRFVKPSDTEIRALFKVALASTQIRFAENDEEKRSAFYRDFVAAFKFIAGLGRTETVDYNHDAVWFAEEAGLVERENISAGAFIVAAIAHHDTGVAHYDPVHRASQLRDIVWIPGPGPAAYTSFRLAKHAGKPATDAWRRLLAGK
jgi:hypothetical protein